MKKLGKKSRSNLIFSLVMLVVCGLLCLIPEAFTNPSSAIPRERVRIESVDNTQLYPLGIVYSGPRGQLFIGIHDEAIECLQPVSKGKARLEWYYVPGGVDCEQIESLFPAQSP